MSIQKGKLKLEGFKLTFEIKSLNFDLDEKFSEENPAKMSLLITSICDLQKSFIKLKEEVEKLNK